MNREELEKLIEDQGNKLQVKLSLSVDGLLIGELVQYLEEIKSLEHSIEKNILALDRLKELENNHKVSEYE